MPHPPRKGRLRRILDLFTRRDDATPKGSKNWMPGDMAECVVQGDGQWGGRHGWTELGPKPREVHVVHEVHVAAGDDGEPCLYLIFVRWPDRGFGARFFRKLTPRADAAERADAAFLHQLNPAALPANADREGA